MVGRDLCMLGSLEIRLEWIILIFLYAEITREKPEVIHLAVD